MPVVPPTHAGVVERFGRFDRVVGPGRIRLLPLVETVRIVEQLTVTVGEQNVEAFHISG